MRALLIGVLLSILCFSSNTEGQKKSKGAKIISQITSKDVRIIKDKPHVFISFESVKKVEPLRDGESEYRVFLRFNNNSRWKVSFCGGAIPFGYGEVNVKYEIFRVEGMGSVPQSWRSDLCQGNEVNPGTSVIISVPREHLANGLAIKIAYEYQWQRDADGAWEASEPKHYCSFLWNDIPDE